MKAEKKRKHLEGEGRRATMDKHERRRLRKNGEWYAKTHDIRNAFGGLLVHQKSEILKALEDYTPQRYLLSRMKDAQAIGEFRVINYYGNIVPVSINFQEEDFLSVPECIRWEIRKSTVCLDERVRYILALQAQMGGQVFGHFNWELVPYVWKEQVLGQRKIAVTRSIQRLQEKMDKDCMAQMAPAFFRAIERTATIRDELVSAYPRWRSVLNCKALKEEIMMAAWHPRRVEHILTTYGWEAYENLLGE